MACLRCAVGKISLHRHQTHGPQEYAKQTVNAYIATTQLQRKTTPDVSAPVDNYPREGPGGAGDAGWLIANPAPLQP